jgi:hypothetical protein
VPDKSGNYKNLGVKGYQDVKMPKIEQPLNAKEVT